MKTVWIDIETLRQERKPDVSELSVPKNYKKKEVIEEWTKENLFPYWNSTALDSVKGRIACVSYAIGDDDPVCLGLWEHENEASLLATLEHNLFGNNEVIITDMKWAGFNLKTFDLQFLWRKAIKYGLEYLVHAIPRERYIKNILDVREIWLGQDYQGKGTLHEIADFIGLEYVATKGEQVQSMWDAGMYDLIAEHCNDDVRLTREIARRFFCA